MLTTFLSLLAVTTAEKNPIEVLVTVASGAVYYRTSDSEKPKKLVPLTNLKAGWKIKAGADAKIGLMYGKGEPAIIAPHTWFPIASADPEDQATRLAFEGFNSRMGRDRGARSDLIRPYDGTAIRPRQFNRIDWPSDLRVKLIKVEGANYSRRVDEGNRHWEDPKMRDLIQSEARKLSLTLATANGETVSLNLSILRGPKLEELEAMLSAVDLRTKALPGPNAFLRGRILAQFRLFAEAEDEFRRAEKLCPASPEVNTELGRLYRALDLPELAKGEEASADKKLKALDESS